MSKFAKENYNESNDWRVYCKRVLNNQSDPFNYLYNVIVINPNEYFNFYDDVPAYETQLEVMKLDLNKLRSSDLVIVNFNDMKSLGSMAEMAIAYDRDIPIIGLDTSKQELHPWQICMCERIFNNADEMLKYVKDFYLR